MKATLQAAAIAAAFGTTLLGSCAGPPLTLYTLNAPASTKPTALGRGALVIEITRVILPDEIDNEDILLFDGSTLRRSSHGRWASRLSLQVTDLITQHIAARNPQALVIDQRQPEVQSTRVAISITLLEVTSRGTARVAANWVVTPQDPVIPTQRYRRAFEMTGRTASDRDVVALQAAIVSRLAESIASDPITPDY